ncbi:MAG TPA: DUF4440 domain-containing protein [Rhodothermales bacterium]|nr:DUF4440 domain-containing protein [Rhodothermales bacterium]
MTCSTKLLVPLLLLALGCEPSPAPPVTEKPDTQAAVDSIKAQALRFSQAYMDGDIETLVSIYAEDGVAAPGGRDFIRGRDALRQLWQLPEGREVTHHQSTPEEIIVEGKYAYDWGYYEGAAGPVDGEQRPFNGKYVIVWRQDDDGVWRMLQDMWNRMPDPEEDTAP